MGNFFGRVKQGVAKGVTTASVKSKELVEATKLKSQISDIHEKKKAALEELGNIVYTMFLKDEFPQDRIKARCAAVKALDDEIKLKEEELKEVHAKAAAALGKPKMVATCECGAEVQEGTKFCGKCGKKMEDV